MRHVLIGMNISAKDKQSVCIVQRATIPSLFVGHSIHVYYSYMAGRPIARPTPDQLHKNAFVRNYIYLCLCLMAHLDCNCALYILNYIAKGPIRKPIRINSITLSCLSGLIVIIYSRISGN